MTKREAKSTKASAPAPPEQKKRTGFLDLPAELRLQIYGYLLPDIPSATWRKSALRTDGTASSTNFMATCKQVHGEAAELLYPGHARVTIRVPGSRSTVAFVELFNKKVEIGEAMEANVFQALRQARSLSVTVRTASNPHAVCVAQDLLFEVLRPVSGTLNQRLQSLGLDAIIHRSSGSDFALRVDDEWIDDYVRRGSMHEFNGIKAGDLTRAHSAAFLTDPFRNARNLKSGGKKGYYWMMFPGQTGGAWREVSRRVRTAVQCEDLTDLVDFELFSRYFATCRALLCSVQPLLTTTADKTSLEKQHDLLSSARIMGDVGKFYAHHSTLVTFLNDVVSKVNLSNTETEIQAREVTHLIVELEARLPDADVDTSEFGYNKGNADLAAWQAGSGERRKAKAERKKRKREKADEGDQRGGKKGRRAGGGWNEV
ncbi:hypothetical protein LTR78_005225 [Recurvomyces mirabilis]|uniref:Uncharacterized protein n=1 Tax=Recurvomyces mirabilis TaxID=574656 RepID=A0AAE0WND0_9PEZI|nr:hypothetical protein LTR78_005225 [Recurvomyces mirabilis]KAK5157775.1 hypothetical protein LTS14_003697 [Recurvomyces mirabilis]